MYWRVHWSLSSKKPYPSCESAAIEVTEFQELWRPLNIIHRIRILPVGNVIEPTAQRPKKSQRVKSLFNVRIERQIHWEPVHPGRQHQLLLLIDNDEGEPIPNLKRIGEIKTLD